MKNENEMKVYFITEKRGLRNGTHTWSYLTPTLFQDSLPILSLKKFFGKNGGWLKWSGPEMNF